MLINQQVPNFECKTTTGNFEFQEFCQNNWCLVLCHPSAFTPICTTDLATASQMLPEFQRRNCKVIAITSNTVEENKQWSKDIVNFSNNLNQLKTGSGSSGTSVSSSTTSQQQNELQFPIVSDTDHSIAVKLELMKNKNDDITTFRACMIIAPDRTLKGLYWFNDSIGRNYDELLRVLDALQLCNKLNYYVGTPANWKPNDKVMVLPTAKKEEIEKIFPKGIEVLQVPSGKEYMKLVQPTTQSSSSSSTSSTSTGTTQTRH